MYKPTDFFNECFDETNEYYTKLLDLINSAFDRQKIKESGFEIHHIVPRSFFKKKGIPVDDSFYNKVKFTCEEHYMAHYYCYKCAKPIIKRSMVFALHLMSVTAASRRDDFDAEALAKMYGECRSDLTYVFKQNKMPVLTPEKRKEVHKRAMETRSKNTAYKKQLSERMKGNIINKGNLKFNLMQINLMTNLHNLGCTNAEICNLFHTSPKTLKEQVKTAKEKYTPEEVIDWDYSIRNSDRVQKYVWQKSTDNLCSFQEAYTITGMSEITFVKHLKNDEDFDFELAEVPSIFKAIIWLYEFYKKDPLIISRLETVLKQMKNLFH